MTLTTDDQVAQLPEQPITDLIASMEGILAENQQVLEEARVRMVNVLFVQVRGSGGKVETVGVMAWVGSRG